MKTTQIGQPLTRVDGRAKVTGSARYAAEFQAPGLVYGVVVSGSIARGRISKIDASEALALPGVLHVLTHENRPHLPFFDLSYKDQDAPAGSPFRPFYNDEILYSGQPVALVVAESFELARHAASLVRVACETKPHHTDLEARKGAAYEPKTRPNIDPPPKPRGHADKALAAAAVQVRATYLTPIEHHNPMEMHATTVVVEDDGTLTIHDKTQGVANSHSFVQGVFGLSKDEVRVVSPFVGGAFGSGLRPQYQLVLAVMAARELKRSVRVVLTRQQMFSFGHRPEVIHEIALGASADGKLEAITYDAFAETSSFEDYTEVIVNWAGMAYQCDNVKLGYKVAKLDLHTPLDMRAPGAAPGLHVLESAMDELAHQTGVDPVELRLRNYADRDQNHDKPFSSKELRACYRQGAERFGWSRRTPAPRSMRDGKTLIGWGMATGMWDALQMPASARAVLTVDGKLTVSSGTADIGTGTYTVMTQIAAATLGLPVDHVSFKLGDTALPMAPLEGGSWTVSSVGTAVREVCDKLREKLLGLAKSLPRSPLAGASLDDVTFAEGILRLNSDPSRHVTIAQAMRGGNVLVLDEKVVAAPNKAKQSKYTLATHSAVFAEVRVDEDLGTIEVSRVVSAIAGGRVVNPLTARSQILGGIVWGISMALHEESIVDHQLGRILNHNLAEYHIPVHADVRDLDVIFVDEHDDIVNPLGVKGLGEIGMVGVAAAVGNAVFHATGKRVRDLPITLDKVRG